MLLWLLLFFFFQAEDGIRDAQESRGLGDVYKRQGLGDVYKRQTREDALSFLMAGASVVQVGSMTFAAPDTMANLVDELYDYCKLNALENIRQIVGIL